MFKLQPCFSQSLNQISVIEKYTTYNDNNDIEEDSLSIRYKNYKDTNFNINQLINKYRPEEIITEVIQPQLPIVYLLPEYIEYHILYDSINVGKVRLVPLSLTTLQVDKIELIFNKEIKEENKYVYYFEIINEIKSKQPLIKKLFLSPEIL